MCLNLGQGNLLSDLALPWDTQNRLVTLLAMANFLADLFLAAFRHLRDLEQIAERQPAQDNVGDDMAETLLKGVNSMQHECERLRLDTPQKRWRRIDFDFEQRPNYPVTWEAIHYELKVYRETIEDALEDCIFVAIPQDKAKYVKEPNELVSDLAEAFPLATAELKLASKCLASGFQTASVFHCMNALEQGLRTLAQTPEVNATFKAEIEVENRKNIIDVIQAAIDKERKRIEQDDPKGLDKLAKLKLSC